MVGIRTSPSRGRGGSEDNLCLNDGGILLTIYIDAPDNAGMTSTGFSKVYLTSAGGKSVNEDTAGMTGSYAWVLDGVTGHQDNPRTDGETDGQWYVEQLNDVLQEQVTDGVRLDDLARESIATVRQRFRAAVDAPDDDNTATPAATGVLVHRRTSGAEVDEIEYLILGDCTLVIEKRHTVVHLSDRRAAPKEQEQIEAMQDAFDRGAKTPEEAREMAKDAFLKNKDALNSRDGHWAFGLLPEAVDKSLMGTFEVNHAPKLHLMTDGFASLVDLYHIYPTWEDAVTAIKNQGHEAVLSEIRDVEASDPNLREYPRTKPADDATLLTVVPEQ